MQEFTYEYAGVKTTLVYSIQNNEQINECVYEIVMDRQIKGLAPIITVETKKGRRLVYDVSSKITIEKYFAESLSKEKFLRILLGIINSIQEAGNHKVRLDNLMMDRDLIFVDPYTYEVNLMCLPIATVKKTYNLSAFFKGLIISGIFDSDEDTCYVASLINFLNSNATFLIEQYKGLVVELLHSERQSTLSYEKFSPFYWLKKIKKCKRKSEVNQNSGTITSPVQELQQESLITVTGKLQGSVLKIEPMLNAKHVTEKSFLKNYGKPYLIREKTNEKIKLNKIQFRIGSDPKNTDYSILDNATISRQHAMVVTHNNRYYIVDSNSTNRTYVDGKVIPFHQQTELLSGADISISNEKFRFYY